MQKDNDANEVESSNQKHEDVSIVSTDSSVGGVIRSSLRTLARRVLGQSTLGSLPLAHPKVVARKADVLSDLLELKKSISHTHEIPLRFDADSVGKDERLAKRARFGHRIMGLWTTGASFIRSSLAGGAVFTAYEFVTKNPPQVLMFYPKQNQFIQLWEGEGDVVLPPPLAFYAGMIGGSLHAAVLLVWERVSAGSSSIARSILPTHHHSLFPPPPSPFMSPLGTVLAHSASHATLFSSYEYIKFSLLQQHVKRSTAATTFSQETFTNDREFILYSTSAVAGAIAGALSEVVGFYTAPISEFGLQHVNMSFMRSLGLPSVRTLLSAMLPSSLGFMAYEYGIKSMD